MSRAVVTLHLFVLTIMLLHELAMVVLVPQGAKKQLCLSKGYLHTVAFRSSPCLLLLRQAGCSVLPMSATYHIVLPGLFCACL